MTYTQAVQYLGAVLPSIPMALVPVVFFLYNSFFYGLPELTTEIIVMSSLYISSIFLTAFIGFKFGKFISELIDTSSKPRLLARTLLALIAGSFWGMFSGGIGGILLLGYGAIPGAILGAFSGGLSLSIFTFLFDLLEYDRKISSSRFLPIATGLAIISPALLYWLIALIAGIYF